LQQPDNACHLHYCLQDDPDMEEEITPAVVACGSEYTASITRRGQLLTWGLGSRGELGHELPNAGEVGATTLRMPWQKLHASVATVTVTKIHDHAAPAGELHYAPYLLFDQTV
jgi:alpha-tubulin suppressor-like RCC1 family protein